VIASRVYPIQSNPLQWVLSPVSLQRLLLLSCQFTFQSNDLLGLKRKMFPPQVIRSPCIDGGASQIDTRQRLVRAKNVEVETLKMHIDILGLIILHSTFNG
jgi:hypothetical protein